MDAAHQDHDCGAAVSTGSTSQVKDWGAGQRPKPTTSTNRTQT